MLPPRQTYSSWPERLGRAAQMMAIAAGGALAGGLLGGLSVFALLGALSVPPRHVGDAAPAQAATPPANATATTEKPQTAPSAVAAAANQAQKDPATVPVPPHAPQTAARDEAKETPTGKARPLWDSYGNAWSRESGQSATGAAESDAPSAPSAAPQPKWQPRIGAKYKTARPRFAYRQPANLRDQYVARRAQRVIVLPVPSYPKQDSNRWDRQDRWQDHDRW